MFCEPFLSVMGAGIMSFRILIWMLQQRQNNEDFHRKAAFSFLLSAGLQLSGAVSRQSCCTEHAGTQVRSLWWLRCLLGLVLIHLAEAG